MTHKTASGAGPSRRTFLASGAALAAAAALPVEAASAVIPTQARPSSRGASSSSHITRGVENSTSIDLYYEDHGSVRAAAEGQASVRATKRTTHQGGTI